MTTRLAGFCIRRRWWFLAVLAILTLVFAYFAAHIQIKTIFADLEPSNHPWIEVNNKYAASFGSANMVSIMVAAKHGTIFNQAILETIQKLTRDLRKIHGVNSASITSLASEKLSTVVATSDSIESVPLMWPDVPKTQAGIKRLEAQVVQNPLAYGNYVSRDLTSGLITVDFYDRLLDNEVAFKQINALIKRTAGPDVSVYVVGQPMLAGWVRYYLPETAIVALITVLLLAVLLFLLNRSYRGTFLPLLSGLISAAWALGIGELLGFNLDPLIAVVALIITARSVSHSVQLVTRFDDINALGLGLTAKEAAERSLREMFRPGSVGVLADAAAILVVLLTPIPFLQKVSIIGAIWVGTIFVSAVLLTPVLLSFLKTTGRYAHPVDLAPAMHTLLNGCLRLCTGRVSSRVVVAGAALVFAISLFYAFRVAVGDVNPGSPILKPDSEYNIAGAKINASYPGSNRMFVVVHGDKKGAVTEPEVLDTMALFQRQMTSQPEVGGANSIVDAIATTNQALHGNNPRYYQIADSAEDNAQFLYLAFSHADSSEIEQFTDLNYQDAAINLFFHDHTGDTIRTAFHQIKDFIATHPMKDAKFELAGGFIGVLAAVNDVLLRGQMEAIALGLLVVVLCAMLVYRSTAAGLYFMVPVVLSNTVTFAYMSFEHIGLSINTVPVVALGIGLGVDYSFYIADGIREEVIQHGDVFKAMKDSLNSAGRGVLVTGVVLVATIAVWIFSSLRFQADMAKLIALWLSVSALSALIIMPTLAYMLRPKFIFGGAPVAKEFSNLLSKDHVGIGGDPYRRFIDS